MMRATSRSCSTFAKAFFKRLFYGRRGIGHQSQRLAQVDVLGAQRLEMLTGLNLVCEARDVLPRHALTEMLAVLIPLP